MPNTQIIGQVLPIERNEEILSSTDDKIRREKFFVWKLLERALMDFYSSPNMNLIKKDGNGKWAGLDLQFSLSHSKDLLAVAVSDSLVGVDVQVERPLKNPRLIEKVFSELEINAISKLDFDRKTSEIIKLWTKKESTFKMLGGANFLAVAKTLNVVDTQTFDYELNGAKYYVSVSGAKNIQTIEIKL